MQHNTDKNAQEEAQQNTRRGREKDNNKNNFKHKSKTSTRGVRDPLTLSDVDHEVGASQLFTFSV